MTDVLTEIFHEYHKWAPEPGCLVVSVRAVFVCFFTYASVMCGRFGGIRLGFQVSPFMGA